MSKLFINERAFFYNKSYPITDEAGNEKYLIDEDTGMADFIAYVRDLEGETKVTIKREKIAFGPKYLVTLDNGNRFTITRAQGLLKQDLIAESDDDTLSFSGDLWKFNFQTLNKDREIVAAVRLDSHKGTDAYTLDIYDENYEKEMLGILIVVKNIIGLQRTSSMIIAST